MLKFNCFAAHSSPLQYVCKMNFQSTEYSASYDPCHDRYCPEINIHPAKPGYRTGAEQYFPVTIDNIAKRIQF